jgi:hypothetical protein
LSRGIWFYVINGGKSILVIKTDSIFFKLTILCHPSPSDSEGGLAVPAGRQVSGFQWDTETSLPSVSEGSA